MLSESDLIDQVNPFLSNMPGAWSKPYSPDGYMKIEDQDEEEDESPACEMATTAGDKQIDWCKPGEPNCPMNRELEPTQRADPDISYSDRGDVPFGVDFGSKSLPKKMDTQFFINLIILLIFIVILIKLTERL
jgi:hypothetical protein